MNVLEMLACGVLGGVFAISVIAQLPRSTRLRMHDIFGVLPNWRFFAPVPGASDYHLMYRYRLNDGQTLTPWTEVQFPRRTLLSSIWNPARRERKALFDIAVSIARNGAGHVEQMSLPYLAILSYLLEIKSLFSTPEAIQFGIMMSDRRVTESAPQWLFRSGFHRFAQC